MTSKMVNSRLKLCSMFYKMLISRSRHRRMHLKRLQINQRSHLQYLIKMRKLQYSLHQERFFHLKVLTESSMMCKHRRSPLWWENVQNRLTPEQWLKYFRMKKTMFHSLVGKLSPYLKTHSFIKISLEKQTAIALISLTSGKSNSYIGHMFTIPKADVSTIIENVCLAIKCLMPQYLKASKPPLLDKHIKDFESKWGFPQCAGILGSIHIPLRTSDLPENASDYINSNNGYSMLLQGIVDSSYKFWDINVGWPGSVPESRVFTNSAIWLKGQDRNLFPESSKSVCGINVPIYILAGTSYPLSHWVLRPFLNEPASESEKLFNEKFTYAYNACEIAFKRLKARWNCLVHGSICSIEVFPTVIAACCILHNMCEMNEENLVDDWIIKAEKHFRQPIPSPCNTVIGPQAESIRFAVKESFLCLPSEL